jgi:hypothetical protein
MSTVVQGQVARIIIEKRFGFIRVGRNEYFFHRDDCLGSWLDIIQKYMAKQEVNVNCEIQEDNPKGPRVIHITLRES